MLSFVKAAIKFKKVGGELLLSTVIVNLLALVSSFYSIHVMNRYLTLGIDQTLFTLTLGAVLAIAMEFHIRQSRQKVAQWVCGNIEKEISDQAFNSLSQARYQSLEALPIGQRREAIVNMSSVNQAYTAANLNALYDAPFSLLYIFALSLLSFKLAIVTVILSAIMCTVIVIIGKSLREPSQEIIKQQSRFSGLGQFMAGNGDTVRAFNALDLLQKQWVEVQAGLKQLRAKMHDNQGLIQQVTQSASALLSVALFAVGAREVVMGDLDIGSTIGVSILGARAMAVIGRVAQMSETFEKANQAISQLQLLSRLPTERQKGYVPKSIKGELELVDLSFAYPGHPLPLFESLSVKLRAGGVVAVVGPNASGKSTFSKVLVGLLDPIRGQVKVDSQDVRQLVPEWWRKQIIYVPQEPSFFDGSLRENLTILNPELDDASLRDLCTKLDLGSFLDTVQEGFDMPIRNGGQSLPVGIRRRLAIIRAMAANGKIAILDEPTEGLDVRGIQAVAQQLNQMVAAGKTVIVATKEEFIIKAAEVVIDLGQKPEPAIVRAPPKNSEGENK